MDRNQFKKDIQLMKEFFKKELIKKPHETQAIINILNYLKTIEQMIGEH